jgi:hypothetical protein
MQVDASNCRANTVWPSLWQVWSSLRDCEAVWKLRDDRDSFPVKPSTMFLVMGHIGNTTMLSSGHRSTRSTGPVSYKDVFRTSNSIALLKSWPTNMVMCDFHFLLISVNLNGRLDLRDVISRFIGRDYHASHLTRVRPPEEYHWPIWGVCHLQS